MVQKKTFSLSCTTEAYKENNPIFEPISQNIESFSILNSFIHLIVSGSLVKLF